MIRKYDKPLQQIARRYSENEHVNFQNAKKMVRNSNTQTFEKQHNGRAVTERTFTDQNVILQ